MGLYSGCFWCFEVFVAQPCDRFALTSAFGPLVF